MRAFHRDAAGFQHIAAVAGFQRLGDALLDQQDGQSVAMDLVDALEDRVHDGRCEPHRGLVEHQQLRRRREPAPDRQHLLLAARERAGELVAPFREDRKELQDHRQRFAEPRLALAGVGAHFEIFHHRHRGEHLAPLRHMRDAELRALGRRHREQVLPVVGDLAADRRNDAGDGLEQRGLAGAVRADHGDELAALDLERHAAQRAQAAIGNLKRPDL